MPLRRLRPAPAWLRFRRKPRRDSMSILVQDRRHIGPREQARSPLREVLLGLLRLQHQQHHVHVVGQPGRRTGCELTGTKSAGV